MLLSGTLPFEAETQDDTANLIVDCELKFLSSKWKKLDSRAQKLVKIMLEKKIEKRISLKNVVNDPWLTGKPKEDSPA